jgi:hypothetical protein
MSLYICKHADWPQFGCDRERFAGKLATVWHDAGSGAAWKPRGFKLREEDVPLGRS